MKLSVVIVNYNVKYFLEQCLDSLYKALRGRDFEVFVVDNASSDGSIEFLRSRYPDVIYIENKDNVGFAKANNIAIERCCGEYVLLLNPDTLVSSKALNECIMFLDNNRDAGALSVKMISGDGSFQSESKRSFPTPSVSFYKLTGLSKLFPKSKVFGKYNLLYLDENHIHRIDVFCGAFIMFRRKLLDKSGLLDSDFFMYGEDIDFSYRLMHDTGYYNYYLPVPIIHYKGESTKKDSLKYINAFYGAMLIFYRKHYGRSGVLFSGLIKLGVFLHGVYTYLKENLRSLFHLKNKKEKSGGKFLCVAFHEGEREELLSVKGLSISDCTFVDVLDDKVKDFVMSGGYDFIVFNRDRYSYDEIIDFIDALPGKVELGIFSPKTNVIVTPGKIIE